MKLLRNVIIVFFFVMLAAVLVLGIFWRYNVSAVDKKNDSIIKVVIPSGSTSKSVAKILKEKKLVKSDQFVYVYLRLMKINDIKASTYELRQNMSLEDLIEELRKGNSYNKDQIEITFKEGLNIKQVADIIASHTNNTTDDVYNLLKNQEYLESLIAKYWFIGEDIKNPYIFYSLEGYLYPNTYFFKNAEVTVEDIFKEMLGAMEKTLNKYKTVLNEDPKLVHRTLTLASIVELEGVRQTDRQLIAGVFENRLTKKMSLGSDVTTYYGARLEMSERDLTIHEINGVNMYNTRPASMAGKLPVGPVANPSLSAIDATLNPTTSDYLYFVADKYRRVFFTKTYEEHLAKVADIKAKGEWIQW